MHATTTRTTAGYMVGIEVNGGWDGDYAGPEGAYGREVVKRGRAVRFAGRRQAEECAALLRRGLAGTGTAFVVPAR